LADISQITLPGYAAEPHTSILKASFIVLTIDVDDDLFGQALAPL